MRYQTLLDFLFLFPVLVLAQVQPYDSGGPLIPDQAAYDVTFYDLRLKIDPDKETIGGSNTVYCTFESGWTTLMLNLDPLLEVSAVSLMNGKGDFVPTTFRQTDAYVLVDLGDPTTEHEHVAAKIEYAGKPRVAPQPPWSGGFVWQTTQTGDPWVGVACQGEGADIWWPCKDHPSDEPDSMALHFTVPSNLTCIANGALRSVIPLADQTTTYSWFVSTPINNYGVSLYIAPYEEYTENYQSVTGEEFPLHFWYIPDRKEAHADFIPQLSPQLSFLEEVLGPFPFRADKFGVVETTYLGMEHQTAIAYGNRSGNSVFGYDYGFDALYYHELAHEWFANLITAADWKDFWLHEGFATYLEALYAEHVNDSTAYKGLIQHFRGRVTNRDPIAPRESRSEGEMYGGDIYFKGAMVLHSLRYLFGEQHIRHLLRRFLYPTEEWEDRTDGTQCRFVTTDDFIALASELTGQNLDWFFEVYLRQADLPILQSFIRSDVLHLMWQVPGDGPFPMPVRVKLNTDIVTVDMSSGQGTLPLNGAFAPIIDPHQELFAVQQRVSSIELVDATPGTFDLEQNYPNPFNASTQIRFTIPHDTVVTLKVFDLRGREVETLVRGSYAAGVHQVLWEPIHAASGTYLYTLKAGSFEQTKKLILVQ